MWTRRCHVFTMLAIFGAVTALAQESQVPPAGEQSATLPASELIAGVRAYPPAVLQALTVVARQPDVLRRVAEDPALLEQPERLGGNVSDAVRAALRDLRQAPAALAIAAANPEAADGLAALFSEAPDGARMRLDQIQDAYARAELSAAAEWQRALESRPGALREYRDLVTAFCRAQLANRKDFPVVAVTADEYFLACPPHEGVMAYLDQNKGTYPNLMSIAAGWWNENSPERIDARALPADRAPIVVGRDHLAAAPRESRAAMWSAIELTPGDTKPLVPVIMQPALDQPEAARLARAAAEHARLWSPPPDANDGGAPQANDSTAPAIAEGPPARIEGSVTMEPPAAPSAEAGVVEYPPLAEQDAVTIVEPPVQYAERPIVREILADDDWVDDYRYVGGPAGGYTSIRFYYSNVWPYYCGYPLYSPIYTVGCRPVYRSYGPAYGSSLNAYYSGTRFGLGLHLGGSSAYSPYYAPSWAYGFRPPCGHSHPSLCTSRCNLRSHGSRVTLDRQPTYELRGDRRGRSSHDGRIDRDGRDVRSGRGSHGARDARDSRSAADAARIIERSPRTTSGSRAADAPSVIRRSGDSSGGDSRRTRNSLGFPTVERRLQTGDRSGGGSSGGSTIRRSSSSGGSDIRRGSSGTRTIQRSTSPRDSGTSRRAPSNSGGGSTIRRSSSGGGHSSSTGGGSTRSIQRVQRANPDAARRRP